MLNIKGVVEFLKHVFLFGLYFAALASFVLSLAGLFLLSWGFMSLFVGLTCFLACVIVRFERQLLVKVARDRGFLPESQEWAIVIHRRDDGVQAVATDLETGIAVKREGRRFAFLAMFRAHLALERVMADEAVERMDRGCYAVGGLSR